MMHFFLVVLGLITLMSSFRLLRGPSFQDRLMALSLVSSGIVLILCTLAVIENASYYLDIAMVYALLAFGEIVAFVRIRKLMQDRVKE